MKTLDTTSRLPRLQTAQVALLGILMALEIVIGRFTLGTATIKFGFTFIVIGLIAKWFGPYWGMLAAFPVDFISTLLNGYSYFWGFALSALVTAAIFGFAFYDHQKLNWWRITIAILVQLLLVNALMNTLWLVIMGSVHGTSAIQTLIWVRAIKQVITAPFQIVILYFFLNNRSLEYMKSKIKH